MKKNDLYDVVSGIDEKYLSDSENFSDISNEFRKAGVRKICVISSLSTFSFTLAAVLFLNSKDALHNSVEKDSLMIEDPGSMQSDIVYTIENSSVSSEVSSDNRKDDTTAESRTEAVTDHTEQTENKTDISKENSAAETIENKISENIYIITEAPSVNESEIVSNTESVTEDNNSGVLKENYSDYELGYWLGNKNVVWGSSEIKGDSALEKIAVGSTMITDALYKLIEESENANSVYAVMVDFSSCVDEDELLNFEYNGSTISELQSECSELMEFTDKTYTYVGSDGIEHTGYFSSGESKEKIKKLNQAINEIKAVYYDMKVQTFSDSFHKNGLEVYRSLGEWRKETNTFFYTFANESLLKEFVCNEDEAFVFYPAYYFK